MNYLVVQRRGKRVGISVVPEGTSYSHEFKAWAIRTGKQVTFVNLRMAQALKNFHVGGNYQDFAWYALDFNELCALIEMHMGPCDEDRYLASVAEKPLPNQRAELIIHTLIEFGWFSVKVLWLLTKMLGILLLIPLLIKLFSKPK